MAHDDKKATSIPVCDRWLHEVWWRIARWPESDRAAGRVALAEYHTHRSAPKAVTG
ncbi:MULTISPECIES: hypothetical protein [Streptomyces]|uniref:hypothetical protein n=1 Tax=Streptomyces TaxID=1883 RepID=UPI00131EE6E1|nr:hypothetical protein [Streptomyces rubrogriseus]